MSLTGCDTITVTRTNCTGFCVKLDVMEGFYEILKTPIIIPSQELTGEIFEGSTKRNSGLDISKSIPLRNSTNITLMSCYNIERFSLNPISSN